MNQFQEFLLQGSILDESVGLIHDRLKGLTTGGASVLHEHGLVFHHSMSQGPMNLHVRRSMDKSSPDVPWLLRYVGSPETLTTNCPVLVRKTVDTLACSNDLMLFLRGIGFRIDYEYVLEGHVYLKGRIKISVLKVFRVNKVGDPSGGLERIEKSHLVEMSAVLPYGQEGSIAQEMKSFADQLKPIVLMEKIDYTALLSK